MRGNFSLVLLALFFWVSNPARAAVTELCNVRISSTEEINFSGTEETWLCGEPDSAAWKRVPIPQQRLFLTGFLQERGYHHPQFTVQDGTLHVEAGAPEKVEHFTVLGAPAEFDESKRRRLLGQTLNKASLDDASAWTKRQLQQMGYPCPKVSSVGLTDQNQIRLEVDAGEKQTFSIVESEVAKDLHPGVIDRYTAFNEHQSFDIRLLDLTSSRILLEDLYMSTYYDVLCNEGELPRVVRRFVPAKPRLLTFGLGFDSEQGPLGRAKLKWTRIDTPANSLETELNASFREQTLSSRFRYHISPNVAPNLELVPNVLISREENASYESLRAEAGGALAYTWERPGYQLRGEYGPVFAYEKTLRGAGPSDLNSIRFNGRVVAKSHLFEYYQADPRSGWTASLETQSQFAGLLTEQTYHRVQFRHQALWNLGRFDPPFAIAGWRSSMGTYFFNDRNEDPFEVSAQQRFFLGGVDDMRGFDLKRLSGNGRGLLTAIYHGFELRSGTWFDIDIQPFIFFDVAKVGLKSLNLTNSLYYAPGLGLRYASPFGAVRLTLGRGYAVNPAFGDPEPGLQFFFTFGKEF